MLKCDRPFLFVNNFLFIRHTKGDSFSNALTFYLDMNENIWLFADIFKTSFFSVGNHIHTEKSMSHHHDFSLLCSSLINKAEGKQSEWKTNKMEHKKPFSIEKPFFFVSLISIQNVDPLIEYLFHFGAIFNDRSKHTHTRTLEQPYEIQSNLKWDPFF